MSREWKPGDVAVIRVDEDVYVGTDEIVTFMRELIDWWPRRPSTEVGIHGGTSILRFLERAFRDAEIGGRVVIDPEDREAVARLLDLIRPGAMGGLDILAAALREYANPTPPKPEEPTGLGAVVEDSNGDRWVRMAPRIADFQWFAAADQTRSRAYRNIAAVRVLSEGVTP